MSDYLMFTYSLLEFLFGTPNSILDQVYLSLISVFISTSIPVVLTLSALFFINRLNNKDELSA